MAHNSPVKMEATKEKDEDIKSEKTATQSSYSYDPRGSYGVPILLLGCLASKKNGVDKNEWQEFVGYA